MSTCPCYTDLTVVKKSYGGSCDNRVCGKTEYLKPVGEFTKNFDVNCAEIIKVENQSVIGPLYKFDSSRFKLKANVPTNQIVTFHVDIKLIATPNNAPVSGLLGGNHLKNVPVYCNVSYGFLNEYARDESYPNDIELQLVFNPSLNGAIAELFANQVKGLYAISVTRGTQIVKGIH